MKNAMITKEEQKALALWAADCAERVLPFFEEAYPRDKCPRDAIKSARLWVRGKIKCGEARKAALAAHASAKKCHHFSAPQFAARAAGQAVATAHVPQHAFGAAYYTLKIAAADSANANVKVAKELNWQTQHLPKNLRKEWLDWQNKKLPKSLKLIIKAAKKN
jgi:hypothetical protein